jgi:GntR family transcriptional regulator
MIFKENKPIFLQIADRLCEEIMLGRYAEGERIPGVREYAATVEVNVNTVVRSFDHLQGKGVVQNKRGLGYFVSEGAVKLIYAMRRDEFLNNELPEVFHQMQLLGITLQELDKLYQNYVEKNVSNQ